MFVTNLCKRQTSVDKKPSKGKKSTRQWFAWDSRKSVFSSFAKYETRVLGGVFFSELP